MAKAKKTPIGSAKARKLVYELIRSVEDFEEMKTVSQFQKIIAAGQFEGCRTRLLSYIRGLERDVRKYKPKRKVFKPSDCHSTK